MNYNRTIKGISYSTNADMSDLRSTRNKRNMLPDTVDKKTVVNF